MSNETDINNHLFWRFNWNYFDRVYLDRRTLIVAAIWTVWVVWFQLLPGSNLGNFTIQYLARNGDIHSFEYVDVDLYLFACVCVDTLMYFYVLHLYVMLCICIYIYVYMYACIYMYICLQTYICVCVILHIHIHIVTHI